jgi:hypothetical protein
VNLEPEPLLGLGTRHHADVSTIQHTELLVLAADQAHDGFSLGHAAEVVLLDACEFLRVGHNTNGLNPLCLHFNGEH